MNDHHKDALETLQATLEATVRLMKARAALERAGAVLCGERGDGEGVRESTLRAVTWEDAASLLRECL